MSITSKKYSSIYAALIGLASLAILLQGLWAGIFLQRDGERDLHANWIDIHARGGEAAIAIVVIAFVLALTKLRDRRELWIGTVVLGLLLIGESYIGGLIRDGGNYGLTIVHIPTAMLTMALAVWLSVRSRQRISSSED